MPNAYWNAHSDRDWEELCGIEDKLPCEMCESSSGNFCLVCGFEEGEDCPYEAPSRIEVEINRDLEAAKATARVWDQVFDRLFGGKR